MNYKKPRCRWTQNLASLNPELNPEARRILEKLLADETIPERQDLEGLKIPISELVKVHRASGHGVGGHHCIRDDYPLCDRLWSRSMFN